MLTLAWHIQLCTKFVDESLNERNIISILWKSVRTNKLKSLLKSYWSCANMPTRAWKRHVTQLTFVMEGHYWCSFIYILWGKLWILNKLNLWKFPSPIIPSILSKLCICTTAVTSPFVQPTCSWLRSKVAHADCLTRWNETPNSSQNVEIWRPSHNCNLKNILKFNHQKLPQKYQLDNDVTLCTQTSRAGIEFLFIRLTQNKG